MKRRSLFALLAVVAILALGLAPYWTNWLHNKKYDDSAIPVLPVPKYIAHAGGGIGGASYTNSRDAFDANYRRGFRFFETDLNWTSDDQLVLIHDWEASFVDHFSKSKGSGRAVAQRIPATENEEEPDAPEFCGIGRLAPQAPRRMDHHRRERRQPPGVEADCREVSHGRSANRPADLHLRGIRAGAAIWAMATSS